MINVGKEFILNGTGTIDFSLLAEEEKEKKKSKSTLHVI
jgi:hypothetical protein